MYIDSVKNGGQKDGCRFLARGRYSLFLTDIHLPGLFLFGGHMADLVDRNRVIEILEQMRDRRKGSCSRQAMIEATAMQYAIEVVKKVPREAEQTDKD